MVKVSTASKAGRDLTTKDRKGIIAALNDESEVLITKHEVLFMPSMGDMFTFISEDKAPDSFVSSKGHVAITLKISDKRATHTQKLKSSLAYSLKAGTSRDGAPVLVSDDFISTYRFAGKTFHNPNMSTVRKEMTEQLRNRMAVYMKSEGVDKNAFKIIRANMNESLRLGFAFKTTSLVTRNKANGMLCMWKNWSTKDDYKMVMTAFMYSDSKAWTPFTNYTEQDGYKASGKLGMNHCTSIQVSNGLGCAMKALTKK